MINKEDFLKVIEISQKMQKDSLVLYQEFKIDLFDYEDNYHKVIELLTKNVFNKNQKDWYDWWVYERIGPDNKINKAYDNGKEIDFDTPELLYDYIKDLK